MQAAINNARHLIEAGRFVYLDILCGEMGRLIDEGGGDTLTKLTYANVTLFFLPKIEIVMHCEIL